MVAAEDRRLVGLAAGTFPEPATLTVTTAANGVLVSWDDSASGCILEESASLANPNWQPVGGIRYGPGSYTYTGSAAERYWRLRNP